MAISHVFIASIFISLLLVLTTGVQAIQTNDHVTSSGEHSFATAIDCGGLCAVRCSLSSRPNLCKRACGTCCARCQCVPPGTSGNYEACACYATMTTRGNKLKCP